MKSLFVQLQDAFGSFRELLGAFGTVSGCPESIFNANLLPTWPELPIQNRIKSLENRCQDALYFGLHFWTDFRSILAPNLDRLDLKKRGFTYEK